MRYGSSPSPDTVLPVNGRLENVTPRIDFPLHRKPKNFASAKDAHDCGMYLRAMVSRAYDRTDNYATEYINRLGWEVTNVGTEGTGSAGGYLVPPVLAAALIDVRDKVGVMPQLLRNMPMTSDTLTINRRASGLTVYVGTESPTSDMTASDKGWEQIELLARKRYVVHQISQELVDDALIAVVDDAVGEMGHAFAQQLDNEVINGDGTSTYGGIMGIKNGIQAGSIYTAPSGDDTWPELALDDFTSTMGKLPDRYSLAPAWLCSSAFYHGVMLRVQAQAGGNAISSLQGGDGGTRQFLGYPVHLSSLMPTATAVSTISCYFGTFSQGIVLGERMGVRVARSDDYAFLKDLVTLKATTRYDVKYHAPGDASNAGAIVALKTAAS